MHTNTVITDDNLNQCNIWQIKCLLSKIEKFHHIWDYKFLLKGPSESTVPNFYCISILHGTSITQLGNDQCIMINESSSFLLYYCMLMIVSDGCYISIG